MTVARRTLLLIITLSLSMMACEDKKTPKKKASSTTTNKPARVERPIQAPIRDKLETVPVPKEFGQNKLDWSWAPGDALMWMRGDIEGIMKMVAALAPKTPEEANKAGEVAKKAADKLAESAPRSLGGPLGKLSSDGTPSLEKVQQNLPALDTSADLQVSLDARSLDAALLALRYGLPFPHRLGSKEEPGLQGSLYHGHLRLLVLFTAQKGQRDALAKQLAAQGMTPPKEMGEIKLGAEQLLIEQRLPVRALPELEEPAALSPTSPLGEPLQATTKDAASLAFARYNAPLSLLTSAGAVRKLFELLNITSMGRASAGIEPRMQRAFRIKGFVGEQLLQLIDHPDLRDYQQLALLISDAPASADVILSRVSKAKPAAAAKVACSAPVIKEPVLRADWRGMLDDPAVDNAKLAGYRFGFEAEKTSQPDGLTLLRERMLDGMESVLWASVFAPNAMAAYLSRRDDELGLVLRQMRALSLGVGQDSSVKTFYAAASLLMEGQKPSEEHREKLDTLLGRFNVEYRIEEREGAFFELQLVFNTAFHEAFPEDGPISDPSRQAIQLDPDRLDLPIAGLSAEKVRSYLKLRWASRFERATYRHIQLTDGEPRPLEITDAGFSSAPEAPHWMACQLNPLQGLRPLRAALVDGGDAVAEARQDAAVIMRGCFKTGKGAESERLRWVWGQMLTLIGLSKPSGEQKASSELARACELGAKRACAVMGK